MSEKNGTHPVAKTSVPKVKGWPRRRRSTRQIAAEAELRSTLTQLTSREAITTAQETEEILPILRDRIQRLEEAFRAAMTEGDEAFAEVIDKLVHAGNDAAEIRRALQTAISKLPDSQLTTFFPASKDAVWSAPTREHLYDAGIDLRISRGVRLAPGASARVPTGTSVSIPQGYFGLLAIRSGLGAQGITLLNGVGIIDHGYEGEIGLILANFGTEEWSSDPGTRVAQLIVVPCSTGPISFTSMAQTQTPKAERGDGGFGSTGTA